MFPVPTYAHAFGQLYALPIPVWLYIFGGGITLIISFAIIGLFINAKKTRIFDQSFDISSFFFVKLIHTTVFKKSIQVVSLVIWTIVIVAGFIGDQTPTNNLTPLFFWIFFLLGGIYLAVCVGNFWRQMSPIQIVYTTMQKYIKITPLRTYPEKLGYIPALIWYYLLVWIELLSRGWAVMPHILAIILVGYFVSNIIMTIIFGEKWLEYGELFAVLFGNLSRMSFVQRTHRIRLPFAGLVQDIMQHQTLLIFVLFMLSSTAFDGLRSTIVWRPVQYGLYPFFTFLSHDPFVVFPIIQSIALFLSPFIFVSLYILSVYLMKKITKTTMSLVQLSLAFGFSLLPIALAYNIAHYFTLVMTGFGSLLMLISDPFNMGWNLFQTAHLAASQQLLRATTIWNVEVTAIVGGHIVAVYVAHLIALRIFPSHKQAVLSQIPILLLMVVYTITGLWILSQPLTVGF